MYIWETKGVGNLKQDMIFPADLRQKSNGYAVGKKWATVTIAMWKEDIKKGLLFESELYGGVYPAWWLDEVLYGIKT